MASTVTVSANDAGKSPARSGLTILEPVLAVVGMAVVCGLVSHIASAPVDYPGLVAILLGGWSAFIGATVYGLMRNHGSSGLAAGAGGLVAIVNAIISAPGLAALLIGVLNK
jgi:hypothetical protein